MRWIARAGALLAALVPLAAAHSASALDLQSVGTYNEPVFVTSDPTNPDRLFIVERRGRVTLNTPTGNTTFVNLTPLVESDFTEQGLLSMAFAPDYATSGLLYVFYTGQGDDGSLHVDELRASGDTADRGTLRHVITIPHPDNNHNGGQIQFGPDGYLYISTGDGGGARDPEKDAQNKNVLLGKILRIDPARDGNRPYTVPPDNPFVDEAGAKPEIWSYGLRNPARFSFDRGTGALTIGDVGQDAFEEINYSPAPHAGKGANYGWNCREGSADHLPGECSPNPPGMTDPVLTYPHSTSSSDCAVTGGYVVRDPGLTELAGRYVYADYCTGMIRSAVLALPDAIGDRPEDERLTDISSFGEDSCGRVYVASFSEGTVSRLVDSTPTVCPAIPPPPIGDCVVRLEGDGKGNRLEGGPASQLILGNAGKDRIRGGEGNDCISGGRGDDVLNGNSGADRVGGGPGADVIRARDGERDRVICGGGRDRAFLDHKDRAKGCERKARKAA